MIYIRVCGEQAAALKGLCSSAGLHDIVAQIDSQKLEFLVPTSTPAIAIWRQDVGPEEVWNDVVADAMYRAMQASWSHAKQARTRGDREAKGKTSPVHAKPPQAKRGPRDAAKRKRR